MPLLQQFGVGFLSGLADSVHPTYPVRLCFCCSHFGWFGHGAPDSHFDPNLGEPCSSICCDVALHDLRKGWYNVAGAIFR